MAAQLALRHHGIESLPLKARNRKRAADGAIAAPDALAPIPANNASDRLLIQSLKGAAGGACGIETLHALPLNERRWRAIGGFVELDDVAGKDVQVDWGLVQAVAAYIFWRIISLVTGGFASFTSNA
jgi:hypothetical protein